MLDLDGEFAPAAPLEWCGPHFPRELFTDPRAVRNGEETGPQTGAAHGLKNRLWLRRSAVLLPFSWGKGGARGRQEKR